MVQKRNKAGDKVMMGQVAAGTYSGIENRIPLFDGKFTTGYKIVEFQIADKYPTTGAETVCKLSTEPKSNISNFNWQDIQEVAWATDDAPSANGPSVEYIRDDVLIIEDLWFSAYSGSDNRVINYKIKLEAYDFPAWDGAGAMVQNISQAGPA